MGRSNSRCRAGRFDPSQPHTWPDNRSPPRAADRRRNVQRPDDLIRLRATDYRPGDCRRVGLARRRGQRQPLASAIRDPSPWPWVMCRRLRPLPRHPTSPAANSVRQLAGQIRRATEVAEFVSIRMPQSESIGILTNSATIIPVACRLLPVASPRTSPTHRSPNSPHRRPSVGRAWSLQACAESVQR